MTAVEQKKKKNYRRRQIMLMTAIVPPCINTENTACSAVRSVCFGVKSCPKLA